MASDIERYRYISICVNIDFHLNLINSSYYAKHLYLMSASYKRIKDSLLFSSLTSFIFHYLLWCRGAEIFVYSGFPTPEREGIERISVWLKSQNHWVTDYPKLEGTHKNYQSTAPACAQNSPKNHAMCLRALSKCFLNSGRLSAVINALNI